MMIYNVMHLWRRIVGQMMDNCGGSEDFIRDIMMGPCGGELRGEHCAYCRIKAE